MFNLNFCLLGIDLPTCKKLASHLTLSIHEMRKAIKINGDPDDEEFEGKCYQSALNALYDAIPFVIYWSAFSETYQLIQQTQQNYVAKPPEVL